MAAKYGIVICPACGKARGIEASRKTSSCPCGRQVRIRKSMLKFETDSPHELAEMVAQANTQLANGKRFRRTKPRAPSDPCARVAQRVMVLRGPAERAEAIARELTAELGDFGVDDVRRVVSVLGRDDPEEIMTRLKDSSLVYEVCEGRYRIA